ncbi:MAG: sulfatase-like hydrolase/transferase, partial [Paludibacteraceae bacterium]|nr:sulfatase-like hydrolase/transferase [Paludibacteraceae bacterium]
MKQRAGYLLRLYFTLLMLFIAQKWVFLWADAPAETDYSLADALAVAWHGLLLDIPTTGYLIALPLLAVTALGWWPRPLKLRRLATPYYVFAALLMAAAFVADLALYPFWRFKLDATIFYYIDSPRDAFASVSAGYLLVRLIAIIMLTAAVTGLLRAVTPRQADPLTQRWQSLLLLIAVPPIAISIRGGLGESTTNIGKVYFSPDEYLNHAAVNPLFSMLYSLDKAENYGDEFNYYGEQERAAIMRQLLPTDGPAHALKDTLLTTNRPNILIILMESFGGQFVEAISGRSDITPNYNRLTREGILFSNCYSNSFRTDRGTVSTLSGWPAFPTLSVM